LVDTHFENDTIELTPINAESPENLRNEVYLGEIPPSTKDKQAPIVVMVEGTTITAALNVNGVIGIGVARCNPIDHYNKKIGVHIAIARAIREIVDKYENVWVMRAKTKEEVAAQRAAKRRVP
jgi:hypothetical protein